MPSSIPGAGVREEQICEEHIWQELGNALAELFGAVVWPLEGLEQCQCCCVWTKMSKLFQEFVSEVTEMVPKLLRRDIELCRKLNLSELLGNTNPSSACAKSHWNFCPEAAQLEQHPPWVWTTSIPGQSLELRKTETPKSERTHWTQVWQNIPQAPLPHPTGIVSIRCGSRDRLPVSLFLIQNSWLPTQLRALISPKTLPPVPWNCKQGIRHNSVCLCQLQRGVELILLQSILPVSRMILLE